MTPSPTKTSLGHIRVLDLTRVLAGPWCAQNLADLGADVIKVERPGAGDDTRSWGPPYLKDDDGHDTSEAAYYLAANRGKRSITLDISTPEGQQIVRELVRHEPDLEVVGLDDVEEVPADQGPVPAGAVPRDTTHVTGDQDGLREEAPLLHRIRGS